MSECAVCLVAGFVSGFIWPHVTRLPLSIKQPELEILAQTAPELENSEAPPKANNDQQKMPFVASKSSDKFHPSEGCSYADRIKEENRIYFSTEQEAMAAGYEPSSCIAK